MFNQLRECVVFTKGNGNSEGSGSQTGFELRVIKVEKGFVLSFVWRDVKDKPYHVESPTILQTGLPYQIAITRRTTMSNPPPTDQDAKNKAPTDQDAKDKPNPPVTGQEICFYHRQWRHVEPVFRAEFRQGDSPCNLDQPLYIGGAPYAPDGTCLRGTVSDFRLYSSVLGLSDLFVTSPPKTCVLWYKLSEPLDTPGIAVKDDRGSHDGRLFGGVTWQTSPCPSEASFQLLLNGIPAVTSEFFQTITNRPDAVLQGQMMHITGPGCPAELSELRIWRQARTREEITDNIFTPLASADDRLLGYYPFTDDCAVDGTIRDHSLTGWDLQCSNPHSCIATSAPIGSDAPLVAEMFFEGLSHMERSVDSGAGMAVDCPGIHRGFV
jgi:hypothetical protein